MLFGCLRFVVLAIGSLVGQDYFVVRRKGVSMDLVLAMVTVVLDEIANSPALMARGFWGGRG